MELKYVNDRELLEYIAAQVGTLTKDVTKIQGRFDKLETEVQGVKDEV
jgi:hypothetical protein